MPDLFSGLRLVPKIINEVSDNYRLHPGHFLGVLIFQNPQQIFTSDVANVLGQPPAYILVIDERPSLGESCKYSLGIPVLI